jgi:hypothetical protein
MARGPQNQMAQYIVVKPASQALVAFTQPPHATRSPTPFSGRRARIHFFGLEPLYLCSQDGTRHHFTLPRHFSSFDPNRPTYVLPDLLLYRTRPLALFSHRQPISYLAHHSHFSSIPRGDRLSRVCARCYDLLRNRHEDVVGTL